MDDKDFEEEFYREKKKLDRAEEAASSEVENMSTEPTECEYCERPMTADQVVIHLGNCTGRVCIFFSRQERA